MQLFNVKKTNFARATPSIFGLAVASADLPGISHSKNAAAPNLCEEPNSTKDLKLLCCHGDALQSIGLTTRARCGTFKAIIAVCS